MSGKDLREAANAVGEGAESGEVTAETKARQARAMAHDALPDEWDLLASWLPDNLEPLAREHRFIRRARRLQDASLWLRLFLMHVAGGLSLKQTVARAAELGLARVSSVALFKRLRCAEPWLRSLTGHLLQEQRKMLGPWAVRWPAGVRVVDATEVVEPGAKGSSWRIHYSLRLPEMACDHYELTDSGGGEKKSDSGGGKKADGGGSKAKD